MKLALIATVTLSLACLGADLPNPARQAAKFAAAPPLGKSGTVMFRVQSLEKDKLGQTFLSLTPMLAVNLAAAPTSKTVPNEGDVLTCVTGEKRVGTIQGSVNSTSSVLTLDCGKELKLFVLGIEFPAMANSPIIPQGQGKTPW